MKNLMLQEQDKNKDLQLEQEDLQQENTYDYLGTEIYKTDEHKRLTDDINKLPPKEMTKAQQRQWDKNHKENKAQLARLQQSTQAARNEFFKPSEEYAADMSQSLDALENNDVDSITSAFYQTMLHKNDEGQGRTLDPKTLLSDDHRETPDFSTLCTMLDSLQETSPEALSAEKAKEMVGAYKGLKLTTGEAGSVRYLTEMTESVNGNDEWSDEVAAKDPKSSYLLLYYSVTVALRGYVNQQDPTAVNQDAFSKLCAMAMASTIAAGDLCISENFVQSRKANEEEVIAEHLAIRLEEERIEEEQRLAKEAAIADLRNRADNVENDNGKRLSSKMLKGLEIKEAKRLVEEKKRLAEEAEQKRLAKEATIADLRGRADKLDTDREKRSTKRLAKELEANETKRILEARRLLEKERTEKIEKYYKKHKANRSWLGEMGPKLLISFLGEKIFDKSPDFSEGFDKFIMRHLEALNASASSIETFFNGKDELTLGMPKLRDSLCQDAAQRLKDKLFSVENEDDIVKSLGSLKSMDVGKYKKRQGQLGELVSDLNENQRADVWAIPSLQALILNDDILDKEFDEKIKELFAMAKANEAMITQRLKKHVSIYSEETAMHEIKGSLGGLWFLASSAVLSVHLDDRLRNQSIYMPRTKESEKPILKAISSAGLKVNLLPTISAYLEKEKGKELSADPKTLSASLNEFKARKTANGEYFQQHIANLELSDTTWKEFFIWFEKHECEATEKFKPSLDGILKDLAAQYQYPKLTVNQYQKGVKEAEVELNKSGGDYRVKLLRGEELCKHPSFEKLFVGYEDYLMEEFARLLRSDELKTTFPFLEGNQSLEALERIPYNQFQLLVNHVRVNLMLCAESWGKIEGMGSVRVKKDMLYEMMKSGLSQEEFEKKCEEKQKNLGEKDYANRMRLLVALGSPALQPETIRYQHIGATQSTAVIAKRQEFFSHARDVWHILENKGMHESVKLLCLKSIRKFKEPLSDTKKNEKNGSKKSDTKVIEEEEDVNIGTQFRNFMRDEILNLEKKSLKKVDKLEKEEDREAVLKRLQDKNAKFKEEYNMADIRALKEMQAAFDEMNAPILKNNDSGVRRDTMLEFMLCGCEDVLLQSGTKGGKIFKKGKSNEYDSMLYAMAEKTLLRSLESDIALRSLVEGSANKSPEEKAYLRHSLQDKLRPILAQLKSLDMSEKFNYDKSTDNAEKKKQENMKRFGVNSWDELIGNLHMWRNDGKDIFNDPETVEAVNNYHKRRTALETYGGGIFKEAIEYLIADETVWHDMMINTDAEFEASMKALKEKIGCALTAIKMSKAGKEGIPAKDKSKENEIEFSNSLVIQQFLADNFEEIMSGEYKGLEKKKDTDKKSPDVKTNKLLEYMRKDDPAEAERQEKTNYWSERLDQYGKNFLKVNADGSQSIEVRIKYFIAKYPAETSIIGPYLPQLVTSSNDLYSQLFDKSALVHLEKLNSQAESNLFAADLHMEGVELARKFNSHTGKIEEQDSSPAEMQEEEDRRIAFRKEIEHCAILYDKATFLGKLPQLYNAFAEKQAAQSAQKAKEELSKTGHIAMEIESRIQKGMAKDNEGDKQIEGLRHQLYHVGSPILAALNQEKVKGQKEFKKIVDGYAERSSPAPYLAKALLAERLSGKNKLKQSEIEDELNWLCQMLHDVENIKEDEKALSEQRVAQVLTYCYSQKLLGGAAKSADEYFAELKAKEKQLENLQTMKKEAANPLYKAEIEDTINCLKMGQYTMGSDAFSKLRQNKTDYLKAVGSAQVILNEEFEKWRKQETNTAKDKKNDPHEDARLKTALMEYLRDDIRNKLCVGEDSKDTAEANKSNNSEDFRSLVSNRLHDGEFIKYLLERKEREENAVGNLLQLTVDRTAAMSTQYDLDNAVLQPEMKEKTNNKEHIKKYDALDYAQRQIFAIALSMPQDSIKQAEYMLGSKLLRDDTAMSAPHIMSLKNQIAQYISCQTFNPEIDYSRAIGRLIKADKVIDENAFKDGMAFVDFCTSRREEGIPKDFDKLGDGDGSINAAMSLISGANSGNIMEETIMGVDPPVNNMKAFKDKLVALPGIDKKMEKKLGELGEYDLNVLAAVLQNRTVVDYTTGQGAWARSEGNKQEFVNEEARAELMASFTNNPAKEDVPLMNPEDYAKAQKTLFSYQLRDDISLEGRAGKTLAKDDFGSGVLNRGTSVDWALMSRSLDFLKEIKQEKNRLELIRNTRKTFFDIKAKKDLNYNSVYLESKKDTTDETFKAFLEEQSKKDIKNNENDDDLIFIKAGYDSLNETEKELFYTALDHREVLDVSKKNYYTSALGMADREYADPIGREELTNEYLKNSVSGGSRLKVTSDTRKGAIKSLLSAQLDDSVDLTQDASQIDNKSAERLAFFGRKTDVDWKLFHRALQYVHRTSSEEEVTAQDNELYISQGDIKENGSFGFQSNYMRKNLHQTGTRASRFVGRQAVSYIKDQIPGYLQQMAVGLLPVSMANSINDLGIIEGNDALGYVDSGLSLASDTLDKVQGSMDGGVISLAGSVFSSEEAIANSAEKLQAFSDNYMSLASDALAYGTSAYTFAKSTVETAKSLSTLKEGKEEAEEHKEEDKAKTEQAGKEQTEKQKNLSDSAIKRNSSSMNIAGDRAKTQVTSNYVETVLSTITDLATMITGAPDVVGNAIQTGIKTARFITETFKEQATTDKYFDENGSIEKEAARIRKSFDKSREELKNKGEMDAFEKDGSYYKASDKKLVQLARGFNSKTEYSGMVGLNLVRSLLFCASKFNPQKETRVQAIATLTALGLEGVIGKSDNASAQQVFDILMPREYR